MSAPTARQRRTWPQRLLIGFNLFLIVAALVAASGLGYVYWKFGQLNRVVLHDVLSANDTGGAAQNYLVVGVDSAAGLDPDDPVTFGRPGGLRSDTVMVLRVDPGADGARLLSLPRDLWVPIAGTGGNQRINAAVQAGGPATLIETVQQYLNIPIHHYVQVDFLGFQSLVGAVDGVPVYFPEPVRDRNSGLYVETSGCANLDGDQALAFVRARNYQYYEDRWRTDPTGDLGRISRQQDFIRRALRRSVAKGVRNPVTLNELIDVAIDHVTLDDKLTANDLFDLGRRFRSFNPDNLEMYALPTVGDSVGGASVLRLVEDDAQPILDLFRGVDPGDITPANVRVEVQNGSGTTGEATQASNAFQTAGFTVLGVGDAPSFGFTDTVVRHTAESRAGAELIARYVAGPVVLEAVPAVESGAVVVITGSGWDGLLPEPRDDVPTAATAVPPLVPGAPGGAGEPDVTTTTTGPEPTSTTVVGVVPAEPPSDVTC